MLIFHGGKEEIPPRFFDVLTQNQEHHGTASFAGVSRPHKCSRQRVPEAHTINFRLFGVHSATRKGQTKDLKVFRGKHRQKSDLQVFTGNTLDCARLAAGKLSQSIWAHGSAARSRWTYSALGADGTGSRRFPLPVVDIVELCAAAFMGHMRLPHGILCGKPWQESVLHGTWMRLKLLALTQG